MTKHETLFFPLLDRRKKYFGKGDGKKSSYSDYRSEIEEDCKNRCVYCDVSLEEHGYEGMAIDHFRPEVHFPKLSHNPGNLVLACPKCNRSKWHHWPCEKKEDMPSYSGNVGFIDPFTEDRKKFFSVRVDGVLESVKPPATYMLKILNLNRKARIQVRRRRIIQNEVQFLIQACSDCIQRVLNSARKGELAAKEAMQELEKLQSTHTKLQNVCREIWG